MGAVDFNRAKKAANEIAAARGEPLPAPTHVVKHAGVFSLLLDHWRSRAQELGLTKSEQLAYKAGLARNRIGYFVAGVCFGAVATFALVKGDSLTQQWAYERGRASAEQDLQRDPQSGLVVK